MAVGKRAADQHRAARAQDPAKLAGAAGQVGEVMDDSRQPGATAAAVTQGEPLRLPADPGHPSMGSGLLRLVAHTGRRLHRHDSDIEPAGDGGGEQAGPGTEIKHWQAACRRQPDGQGGPPALQSLGG